MADTTGVGSANVGPYTGNVALSVTSGTQSTSGMWAWILGYVMLIVMLWLLNKSRIGHATIYYSLVLMIFFTLVTHPQEITGALAVFGTTLKSTVTPVGQAPS